MKTKSSSKKIKLFWVTIASIIFILQSANFAQAQFKYKLLEAVPGFYAQGDDSTDFPGLILAIYKFGVWTVGIAGLFMLVIGGFMYMASAGNTATAGNAKKIITDALIGIVVVMSAFLVMYVINPDLTKIKINFASKISIDGVEEDQAANPPATVVTSGDMVSRNGYIISNKFNTALNNLQANGIKAQVTSGLRKKETQIALIKDSCGAYPVTKEQKCKYPVCKLLNDDTKNCPHTTGRAADIWALKPGGGQALSKDQCLKNVSACCNNPYQKALIEGMKAEGFCVLSTEPWHFEELNENGNGMSSSCNRNSSCSKTN